MEKKIKDEINDIKQEIYNKKKEINDIKELIKEDIDRDFEINLWELSEKELDNEMGNRLSFLNEDIDPRPDKRSIVSHRKILGKPIIFVKRLFMKLSNIYTNTILEKQRKFNEQLVAFHLASFIRFRKNEEKLRDIEKQIKEIEQNQDIILEKIELILDKKKSNSS